MELEAHGSRIVPCPCLVLMGATTCLCLECTPFERTSGWVGLIPEPLTSPRKERLKPSRGR